eukprot:SM000076S21842  [mRNA]  locus=s76:385102:385910:- [translate_table: standard]
MAMGKKRKFDPVPSWTAGDGRAGSSPGHGAGDRPRRFGRRPVPAEDGTSRTAPRRRGSDPATPVAAPTRGALSRGPRGLPCAVRWAPHPRPAHRHVAPGAKKRAFPAHAFRPTLPPPGPSGFPLSPGGAPGVLAAAAAAAASTKPPPPPPLNPSREEKLTPAGRRLSSLHKARAPEGCESASRCAGRGDGPPLLVASRADRSDRPAPRLFVHFRRQTDPLSPAAWSCPALRAAVDY